MSKLVFAVLALLTVLVSAGQATADVVLKYNAANGNVMIDTEGLEIESIGLENAAGGLDFVGSADFSDFPAGGLSFSTPLVITWSGSVGGVTFNGNADLGNVFPTGLTTTGVNDFLTSNSGYVAAGGSSTQPFSVVPEPSPLLLLGLVVTFGLTVQVGKFWRNK